MSIVTRAEFQAQAGSGTSDASDDAYVAAAVAAAVAYLRWNPTRAAGTTVYLDGTGTPELVLPGRPVSPTLTAVYLDSQGGYGQVSGSFDATTQLTQGEGYLLDADRGLLRLWRPTALRGWPVASPGPAVLWAGLGTWGARPACWPRIPGCVKLTGWQNGYADGAAPDDLKAAVIQVAAWLRKAQPEGGMTVTSESYIDVSQGLQAAAAEQLGNASLPALGTARQLLAAYREPVVAGGVRW